MSFPDHEQQRTLNTLRYIHANPKTAAGFTTAKLGRRHRVLLLLARELKKHNQQCSRPGMAPNHSSLPHSP